MQGLSGKLAVIIGEASGVGYSLVLVFGTEGIHALIADADEVTSTMAQDDLEAKGIDIHAQFCDAVKPDSFRSLAKVENAPDGGIRTIEDLRQMMATHGMELKATHSDEAAQTALRGIRDGCLWALNWHHKMHDQFAACVARVQSIFTQTNPLAAIVG